jgi:hypothetical protein
MVDENISLCSVVRFRGGWKYQFVFCSEIPWWLKILVSVQTALATVTLGADRLPLAWCRALDVERSLIIYEGTQTDGTEGGGARGFVINGMNKKQDVDRFRLAIILSYLLFPKLIQDQL